jgi:hypothetical protein
VRSKKANCFAVRPGYIGYESFTKHITIILLYISIVVVFKCALTWQLVINTKVGDFSGCFCSNEM